MRTVKGWLLVAGLFGGLAFIVSNSGGQPPGAAPAAGGSPVPPPPIEPAKDALPPGPATPTPFIPATQTPPPPTQPPAPTIDQLIQNLADVRSRKAELEKQEQAVLKTLRDRLKAQRELLKKMGVETDEPAAKAPEAKTDAPVDPLAPPPLDVKGAPKDSGLPPLDRAAPEKK